MKVSDALGYDGEIVMSAIHNHTGLYDRDRSGSEESKKWKEKYDWFKRFELEASIDACRQALDTMRPAKYGFGEIESYTNVNRDYLSPHGYWIEARNLAGYSDRTLACIKFVDMEDRLIAAIVNHGTHAVCAYLQRDFDHKIKSSGNFPGIASRFAEQHFGNGAVVLWTSGSAGDQNPLLSHGMQYEYPDGYSTSVPYPDGVGYMQMEFMGRYHGADIVKCIDSIDKYSINMPIKRVSETIGLPRWKKKYDNGKMMAIRMGGTGLRDEKEVPYGELPAIPEAPEMILDPNDEGELAMRFEMIPDGDTVLNPTNHAYFNLTGSFDDIRDEQLFIATDKIASRDERNIPSGGTFIAAGTPADFTEQRTIREAMESDGHGYFSGKEPLFDEFYVFEDRQWRLVSRLTDNVSGRVMETYTDMPSLVFFCANVAKQFRGKNESLYSGYCFTCMETGFVPNAVNCPEYVSPVFKKGEKLTANTVYRFSSGSYFPDCRLPFRAFPHRFSDCHIESSV